MRVYPEKNTRSFGTLICPEFPTLSRICPDLTSGRVAVQAADQNAVDNFDVFACQRCVLFSSKRTKSIFSWGPAPDPNGEVYDAPPDPIVEWGRRCPLLIPLLDAEDLGVVAASKSVRNFHHRFMVALTFIY